MGTTFNKDINMLSRQQVLDNIPKVIEALADNSRVSGTTHSFYRYPAESEPKELIIGITTGATARLNASTHFSIDAQRRTENKTMMTDYNQRECNIERDITLAECLGHLDRKSVV